MTKIEKVLAAHKALFEEKEILLAKLGEAKVMAAEQSEAHKAVTSELIDNNKNLADRLLICLNKGEPNPTQSPDYHWLQHKYDKAVKEIFELKTELLLISQKYQESVQQIRHLNHVIDTK